MRCAEAAPASCRKIPEQKESRYCSTLSVFLYWAFTSSRHGLLLSRQQAEGATSAVSPEEDCCCPSYTAVGAHRVGDRRSPLSSEKHPCISQQASLPAKPVPGCEHLHLTAVASPEGTQTPVSAPQSLGCDMSLWELG